MYNILAMIFYEFYLDTYVIVIFFYLGLYEIYPLAFSVFRNLNSFTK
jgi:hypothetical protein